MVLGYSWYTESGGFPLTLALFHPHSCGPLRLSLGSKYYFHVDDFQISVSLDQIFSLT